jgi:phosphoribosylformylglycinamidine synthase
MVLAVPEASLPRLLALCEAEAVEACVLGRFTDTGRLVVRHGGVVHGDLDLEFLHHGLPRREREAVYEAPAVADPSKPPDGDAAAALLAVLADPNVASKEWVVRQYDHEVQAASAGKPFNGVRNDGPADAAVLAPKLGSRAGIVLGNGLNPRYSRIDPAAMAECALDEAMRNVVAAGGDPDRTAVLDNYCWGNTSKPQRLGELVRASFALRDLALAYRTPFVSGKDSLNNEFTVRGEGGEQRTIAIPGCILVTALSVIPDVTRTVGSDLAKAGNLLYVVGTTRRELGGSVFWKLHGVLGASVPRVDAKLGHAVLRDVARAIAARAVVAAHDCSEGGLGAAAAEMAIGGRLGVTIDLDAVPGGKELARDVEVLFSESQSRFLLEVPPDRAVDLEANLHGVPFARVGTVTAEPQVVFTRGGREVARVAVADAARAWKRPLDLDETLVASEGPGNAPSPSDSSWFGDLPESPAPAPGPRNGRAPRALILRAPGINCERETFDAFARAGAQCEFVHVRQLREQPALLDRFTLFAVPGGFAYGDDIAAGRVLANELRASLGDRLLRFVDRGGLVLGICNGFQALVKLGLLPRTQRGPLEQEATLLHNLSNHYECRWVTLRSTESLCTFLEPGLELRCPAAHGEGYLLARDETLARTLVEGGYRAFVYVDETGQPTERYPANPNGSPGGIAGLTDVTGRVLALMPHPDRAYLPHHLPRWRREGLPAHGDGMALFARMVAVARAEG